MEGLDEEDIEEGVKEKEEEGNDEKKEESDEKKEVKMEEVKPATKQRGIIYLSTIHEGLNPTIIKGRFMNFGNVTRMHFVPLKKKNTFKEAWIEFEDERSAKLCAVSLNGQMVGGKKHCPYRDQLWNIKFIKGLQWSKIFEDREAKEMTIEQKIDSANRKAKKVVANFRAASKKALAQKYYLKRHAKKAKKPAVSEKKE